MTSAVTPAVTPAVIRPRPRALAVHAGPRALAWLRERGLQPADVRAIPAAAGGAKGCKKDGGPTGSTKVQVTFAPSGRVTTVNVGAPFAGTPVGSCIASAFKGASVPSFSGSPVTVSKSVSIK